MIKKWPIDIPIGPFLCWKLFQNIWLKLGLPCPGGGGFPGGFGLQYLRCRCLRLDKRKICLWPMENLVLTNTSLEFWGYD